jgi:CBS domain-containing protein
MVKATLQVSDLMSTNPVTLRRNDSLAMAELAMQKQVVRHMPVVDGSGQICGILSQRDIFGVPC